MQNGVSNMDSAMQRGSSPTAGSESSFLHTEPCPECGSKDNLGRYDDGHGYCFGCTYYEHGDSSTSNVSTVPTKIKGKTSGSYQAIRGEAYGLDKRGISEETCRKYGYSIGSYNGQRAHVANFVQEGRIVGQKLRLKNKDFRTLGDCSGLWGKHLWNTGKKIVITEGEIDALSVAQSQSCKWPVVSIPNGVNSAKKAVAKDLEWLMGFEEIILMFDMDNQGQQAAKEVGAILPPGRCKIASTPRKDANQTLQEVGGSAIVDAIWRARVYRPDGIIAGEDTWDLVKEDTSASTHLYPWEGLN